MVSSPLVSIVTPTKDRAVLLEKTLESVRAQSYSRIEHIVVDGASTDGTVELLRRFEGAYPLRWLSEPDAGMYSAINKGLRMAEGSIVAYLNSDDLYFPWSIEVVVDAFARRPWADFVFGDALNVDDETGAQRIYWTIPFDLDYVRRFRCPLQPAVFWRRSVLEQEGYFDESIRLVADCEYWMRAGAKHRFAKVNEFVAIERDHSGTLRETTARAAGATTPRSSEAGFQEELEEVRARYVSLAGPEHRKHVRQHLLRTRLWSRAYGVSFGLLSLLPKRWRRGPWARLRATGRIGIERIRYLLMHVPKLGKFFAEGAITPSRYWLEPPW